MSYTEQLAAFVNGVSYGALPLRVKELAVFCFIDWLGCVIKAQNFKISEALMEIVREEGGSKKATILGYWKRSSALNAALVNGTMSHVVEFDDIYKKGSFHPAGPVIAAALASSEMIGANGEQFIEGIVAGYEVVTRISEAVTPSHYEIFHTTGTCGTFGASVAAGKVLGLTQAQMINAIGLAGTQAAGLWECAAGSPISKPLHPGKAALNGLLAALLSQRDIGAGPATLEGPRGFCRVFSREDKMDRLVSNLGQYYNIVDTTFKNYPNCGQNHSALDAYFALMKENNIHKDEIQRIIVKTNKTACRIAGIPNPRNIYEAKFSIYYALAAAVKLNQVTLESFTQELIDDPEIQKILGKIKLHGLEELEEVYPDKRVSIVELVLNNGKILSKRFDYRKGDPENPLTEEELKIKFEGLVSGNLSKDQIDGLWANVLHVAEIDNINTLFHDYLLCPS